MSILKDDLALFITAEDIKKMVLELAQKIEKDYADHEIIWVCPLRGSIHFVADLMRNIRLPQQIEFVQMKTLLKGGTVQILKDVGVSITNKHVLVAEEIIDTGRALYYLMNHLELSRPASLKIVTLLDKPARRELPLRADYVGRVIEDRFVVGYGMDSEELGRNFKHIYYLKN
ncbi:MAG: hypoxanthine phosphoribosyltransferase [Bdellovibrionaceae bacterium]|nr:hypoxanthine phosphoribosyltransferase [Pseudobdellovibrionaceae bacterium]MDW8189563.1 hypoxanthine phosphoribosyltransferase [Pseudobdellovibrionaceae bacterium]